MSTFKVSSRKILILGGQKRLNDFDLTEQSSDVISFNVKLGILRTLKEYQLKQPIISLYPCFWYPKSKRDLTRSRMSAESSMKSVKEKDESFIYLVAEQGPTNNPEVVSYSIKSFLPGGENY